jgi:FG-GAP repeat/Bacterial Ig domain
MKFLKWTFLLSLTILLLTAGQCGSAPINQVPTVNAGDDQKVSVNTKVTLTSTANDPEAKPLKYAWKITSKPTNAQLKLSNATKASSSFTPDLAGTYELSITVSDGQDKASDVVIVIADPLNQPPTVNAGEDQEVFVGNIVTLTGVATDPEGKPLNYSWVVTSKPTNSQSKLNNANKASSSFTPDLAGAYELSLSVSDGQNTLSDSVIVMAKAKDPLNQAPTAIAGADQSVIVEETVKLNGAGTDPEGDALSYNWSLIEKPADSLAVIPPNTQGASFVADKVGTYSLALDVSDAQATTRDTLTVTALPEGNVPPQLSAVAAQQTLIDEPIEITFNLTDETPESVIIEASSSDQTLIPDANIVISGTGTNRSLTITPLLLEGSVTISLVATDALGLTGDSSFTLIIAKPFSSSKKLVSPDPGVNDWFGYSVAITDTYALVGAYQADDKGSNSGAAYIYKRNGENWQYVQTLTASNGAALDNFGQIVVLTDTLAIVGARFGDGLVADSGAVYLFERTGEVWTEVQKLSSDDGVANDEFGFSVDMLGDSLFIGADEDDNTGSAYVFKKQLSGYAQIQKLQPVLAANNRFGRSIDVFGNTLMVGTTGDGTLGAGSGAVYVYEKVGDAWSEVDTLTASDGTSGDRFGRAIEMNDCYAVISAVYDDALGSFAGSAYIFELISGVWTERQKLTGNDTDAEDRFGHAVGLSGDYVMIGAYGAGDTGAIYVYKNLGSNWTQVNRLTPADLTSGDYLGADAKMIGNYIIAGARNHDVSANNAGAVYIFKK